MKKRIAFFGAACMVAAFFLTSFSSPKRVIVIDAAHGGHDFGAKIDNHTEKDIVVAISNAVKNLSDENVEVILVREADEFIDLKARVETINKHNPSLVISLHVDSNLDIKSTGVSAHVADNAFYDRSFAEANRIIDAVSNENLKKGRVQKGSFFIIKKSNCPAINLQLGNLSNPDDRKYLISAAGQEEIAMNLAKAISE